MRHLIKRASKLFYNCVIVGDGSAIPNPGPYGFAAAVIPTRDLSDFEWSPDLLVHDWGFNGTNNIAEVDALIEGLKYAPDGCRPLIITDSRIAYHVITTEAPARRIQSEHLYERRTLWNSLVYWKDIDFYRGNVLRITGHEGVYMPHTVCDQYARNNARYAASLRK